MLILIGIFIGMLSGFFGIGGGMLLVPLLVALGIKIKAAIAISIVQMMFSSWYGTFLNLKKGNVNIKEGLWVGIGGFIGGGVGSHLGGGLSDTTLKLFFIGLLGLAIIRLFYSPTSSSNKPKPTSNIVMLFIGMLIGVISIILGIGGSILLTPILVGMLHFSTKKSASMALFFVLFSSTAGFISHLLINPDFILGNGLYLAAASIVGVYIGIEAKEKISHKHHKQLLLLLYIIALGLMLSKLS